MSSFFFSDFTIIPYVPRLIKSPFTIVGTPVPSCFKMYLGNFQM